VLLLLLMLLMLKLLLIELLLRLQETQPRFGVRVQGGWRLARRKHSSTS
jgi:hypothetical protein